MRTILVSRFSAFGDVIISVKVLKAVLEQNPDVNIILLTKKPFAFLFADISRLSVSAPALNGRHKGVLGLYKLSRELKDSNIEAYADIHDVLRTKVLRFFLCLQGIKIRKIRKGRIAKRRLTRRHNKILKPLKNSAERYADVFRKLGLTVDLSQVSSLAVRVSEKISSNFLNSKVTKIGIAPFSVHKQKEYPNEKMVELMELLSQKGVHVFIFGGGKKEEQRANKMIAGIKNAQSIIGKYSLPEELQIISLMDGMLTMDSANMHLASLTDTEVYTIWGATHPLAGFGPFQNPNYHTIQLPAEELTCRPCSVYGNKKCFRGDLACLYNINPKDIVQKLS